MFSGDRIRVVAALARSSVIREYEERLKAAGLKVGMVGVPIISLAGLLDTNKEKVLLLVNIEEGFHSMIAFVGSEVVLCRQKAWVSLRDPAKGDRLNTLKQDIGNTMNYIEDHESGRVDGIWIRLGMVRDKDQIAEELNAGFSCPVRRIESQITCDMSRDEKELFSPVIGQLL